MKKVKQIAAIIGIVLIGSMYLITLISSFFVNTYTKSLFVASLFCTFAVPVMIYAFMLIYKLVNKKKDKENTVFLDQLKNLGEHKPSDK